MPEEFRDRCTTSSGRFHHERRWAFPMRLNFLVTRFAQYLCATEEVLRSPAGASSATRSTATLYHRLGYFSDSQYGMYLTLYDMIRIWSCRTFSSCFALSVRRNHAPHPAARARDEIRAGERHWRELWHAYSHFLEVVRSGRHAARD